MCQVPFIDVVIDDIDRFNFLRDDSYSYIIEKLPNKKEFQKQVKRLGKNKKKYRFAEIVKNNLFNRKNTPDKIIDKAIELFTK